MKKEITEKKMDLIKLKGFLDEHSIMYDRVFYDFKKGYCVVSSANKYILGKIYQKAVYKIACLTSMQRLRFKCLYEKERCLYHNPDGSCNLDFEGDCIFEQAKENVN